MPTERLQEGNIKKVGNVDVILDEQGLVQSIRLHGRTLVLINDPEVIKEQLKQDAGQTSLAPDDELVKGVSTDAIIAARPDCYFQDERMGNVPLRTLKVGDENPIPPEAIKNGHFAALAAGADWGCGSSREHAVQAFYYAGVGVIYAPSIAPIHRANLINSGMFPVQNRAIMECLMQDEEVPVEDIIRELGPIEQRIVMRGGLFPFLQALERGEEQMPTIETSPRAMNIAEKILARHMETMNGAVKPGDAGMIEVDVTLCHDYTTDHADGLIRAGLRRAPSVKNPKKHHSFPDHLALMVAQGAARFLGVLDEEAAGVRHLRDRQVEVARATGIHFHVNPESDIGGSEGICHQIFREQIVRPGQVVAGTDSHTCSAGALNSYAFGVGTTGIATAWEMDVLMEEVPQTVRICLTGKLPKGCTGKDVMLFLAGMNRKSGVFSGKVMEFSGNGLESMTADDQWVLGNMATECSAKTGIVSPNKVLRDYLVERRHLSDEEVDASFVYADDGAEYAETIDIHLSDFVPQVSKPGHTGNAVPLSEVAGIRVDKVYSGSCTAGSIETIRTIAAIVRGKKVAVETHVQAGSVEVLQQALREGLLNVLREAGITVIMEPGCGACLAAGPGGPKKGEVVMSATNRNFPGRMGAGDAYLANPQVVAATSLLGRIPTIEEFAELASKS